MSKAATDPSIHEDNLKKSSPNTYKLEPRLLPKSIVKNHSDKRRTYWCAPRKVKCINSAKEIDDTSAKTEKLKKKRHRKVRKVAKNLRRIDILAQPKSVKQQSGQKHCSFKASEPVRKPKVAKVSSGKGKIISYPYKSLKTNKTKKANNLPNNFTVRSKLQDSSAIVLPKKVGLRLFSLVTKKLKELTNTKNV